jgi:hypothetical protein
VPVFSVLDLARVDSGGLGQPGQFSQAVLFALARRHADQPGYLIKLTCLSPLKTKPPQDSLFVIVWLQQPDRTAGVVQCAPDQAGLAIGMQTYR